MTGDEPPNLPAVIECTVVERLVHAKRHLAAFHCARTPKYLVRTVAWSPRGAVRTAGRLAAWALDAEAEELRTHAVLTKDIDAYHKLANRRDERVRARLTVLGIATAVAAGAIAAARGRRGS